MGTHKVAVVRRTARTGLEPVHQPRRELESPILRRNGQSGHVSVVVRSISFNLSQYYPVERREGGDQPMGGGEGRERGGGTEP